MHRVLISEPHIGSYAACLAAALLFGYALTRWRGERAGVPGHHIDNLALLTALLSLFGARLFSWLFYLPPSWSLLEAFTRPGAGMVFYGGLVFGIATVIGYALIVRLPLPNLMDVCAPGVALGLAIGRVGCFMAGCCWGDLCAHPSTASNLASSQVSWQVQTFPMLSRAETPLAVEFPKEAAAYRQHQRLGLIHGHEARSLPVHPVQLYEAALAGALCMALHLSFRRRSWTGQVAVRLALGYAGIRFVTEFFRADNVPGYGGLTLSQLISVLIAAIAVAVLLVRQTRRLHGIGAAIPLIARIRH